MMTATRATAAPESSARLGGRPAVLVRNGSILEHVRAEAVLEIVEAAASLPPDCVRRTHVRGERINAASRDTLCSLTCRVDAGFVAASRAGAYITLVRVAFGSVEPNWGWPGRRKFIQALLQRAAEQRIDRYEIVVCVPAPPQSDAGARAFDLLDCLMHVVDPRGMLRLQFAH
ncbi:MAG TPA: hypothetical protein VFU02_06075 [Polyangiaceae bacterium]|nr:hypothetical protein [Polyangiaceae bacterium]